MKKLEVVSGSIEGGKWEIHDDGIRKGKYIVKKIPTSEVLSVEKKEQAGRTIYADVTLGTGDNFVAKMGVGSYQKLYSSFLSNGNKPVYDKLPVEKVSFFELILLAAVIIFAIMVMI